MYIEKEDYEEPACLLKMGCKTDEPVFRIPVGRVIGKIDEELSRNDFDAAERVIKYWINEAVSGKDVSGELTLRNEIMGLYRKLEREKEALENARIALELAEYLDDSNTGTLATTYINAATVFKAFSRPSEGLPLFEAAKLLYEKEPFLPAEKLAGLYNNMALCLVDLKRFDEAQDLYILALTVLEKEELEESSSVTLGFDSRYGASTKPEQAITWLNIASLKEAKFGLEAAEQVISDCVSKAWMLLNDESLEENGNLAYVCEKCAPIFGYYGYFLMEEELKERADKIYNRN